MESLQRLILHVDMDAFFAAVEILDQPQLAGQPVIVGGSAARRGVVAAASYEARKFGVHSAMPTATAMRLCPHAVLLPARGDRYEEVSEQIMAILHEFTPLVEQTSVDEAFLDVTGSTALYGPGEQIAAAIKIRIRGETSLTCSIGVAPNKFLAKLGSDFNKPDGLTVIPAETAAGFIAPLPASRIWGVGPRAVERLAALGIQTIGELARYSPQQLLAHFGQHAGGLQALARGEDSSPVVTAHDPKSISRETTFAEFLSDREQMEATLLELADDVAARLRAAGLVAYTVTLKVRDETFATITRSHTLVEPADLGETLHEIACDMLRQKVTLHGRKVRLLGIGAGGLREKSSIPPELFPDPRKAKTRRVAETVDRIREKLGPGSVVRARHLRRYGGLSERGGWEGTDKNIRRRSA